MSLSPCDPGIIYPSLLRYQDTAPFSPMHFVFALLSSLTWPLCCRCFNNNNYLLTILISLFWMNMLPDDKKFHERKLGNSGLKISKGCNISERCHAHVVTLTLENWAGDFHGLFPLFSFSAYDELSYLFPEIGINFENLTMTSNDPINLSITFLWVMKSILMPRYTCDQFSMSMTRMRIEVVFTTGSTRFRPSPSVAPHVPLRLHASEPPLPWWAGSIATRQTGALPKVCRATHPLERSKMKLSVWWREVWWWGCIMWKERRQ